MSGEELGVPENEIEQDVIISFPLTKSKKRAGPAR
jgi:hypothetical protein